VFGYVIYRGTSEDEIWGYDAVYSGRMYIDPNVAIGETYFYRITATNWGGESEPTDVIPALAMVLPGPPGRLEATAGNRYAELLWTSPSITGGAPLLNYTVYRGETPDDLVFYTNVSPTLNRYIDSDVEDGKTYYYMITVTTRAGEGPASDIISVTPLSPPGPPLDLVAMAGDGEVELGWSSPAFDGGREVWGYIIYRGDTPDTLVEVARPPTVLSYTDDRVENDHTYHYAVAAYNSIDEGPLCDAVPARPFRPPALPGLIQNLLTSVDGTTVTLHWDAPLDDGGSEVLGYVVMRGLSSSYMDVVAKVGDIWSYTDEDLQRGKTYIYKVAALNDIGQGDFSPTVQATIEKQKETVADDTSWLLLVVLLCITLITVGAISTTESGRYKWGLFIAPLATRLARDDVLDNRTRHAIHGLIIDNPGIHFSAIIQEYELPMGVASYHLDVLEREDFIRSARNGRRKCFYTTDTKVPRDRLRQTPEGIRGSLMEMVEERPGVSQKELIRELSVDRKTVGYHLSILIKDGSIKAKKQGKLTVYRVSHEGKKGAAGARTEDSYTVHAVNGRK
jgi:predicted transcriptional regulator/fibronectin type 3 domain-containing protein